MGFAMTMTNGKSEKSNFKCNVRKNWFYYSGSACDQFICPPPPKKKNPLQGLRPVSLGFGKSQTPEKSETCRFIPDVQPDEVGPWEDVVTAEDHSDVRHQHILQEGHMEQAL